MSRRMRTNTSESRALLVIPRSEIRYLDEALVLSETAGYNVVGVVRIRNSRRLGSGTVEKIVSEAEELGAGTIIAYWDPPPTTLYVLQKETRRRVIDRVLLILEIFSLHAGSREAKLQIEAARIRHQIPLLREYVRRAKMGEDPGFLGPGEYAIDRYRASLERKLAKIRRELEALRERRLYRVEKRRSGGMIHAAIVGYASAGKTSLFNALTGESKPVGEEYFTTLHPKHKAVTIEGFRVVFVDTVGFIRRIPPEIIEAFHSTLEEISRADTIIFVVDASESIIDIEEKVDAGLHTLSTLGVRGLESRLIVAANKVDLLGSERASKLETLESIVHARVPGAIIVPVSAKTGEGLNELAREVVRVARRSTAMDPV